MASIPKRVETRLVVGIKKFQPILTMAKSKDVNESDIGAAILNESALNAIWRELKRVSPDVKIETDLIREVLTQEVIKREILESEKYKQAEKAIERATNKAARARKEEGLSEDSVPVAATAPAVSAPTATSPVVLAFIWTPNLQIRCAKKDGLLKAQINALFHVGQTDHC